MAKRFAALDKLWQSVKESQHDFHPTTEVFAKLDVDRIARDLELDRKGRERGAKDLPSLDSSGYDTVESAVVERVEREHAHAASAVEDALENYASRLYSLDFDEQFALIEQARGTSLSEFKAEADKGTDELHGLRRLLGEAEDYRAWFREKHGLRRPALVGDGFFKWLKVSVLVLVFMFETAANGFFLAKGSEQGIAGGISEAAGFSFLNVLIAFLSARYTVPRILHRSFFSKLVGAVAIPLYLALALGLNLALAHYREISGTLFEGAGEVVMQSLRAHPLSLDDFNSWLLFGIGLLFSLICFIDSWSLGDPYPGYEKAETNLRSGRDRYIDRKAELIEILQDVREEHDEKVQEIIANLSQRKREHGAILSARSRTVSLFSQHEGHLEQAARTLLQIYREANTETRESEHPARFDQSYELRRTQLSESPAVDRNALDMSVTEAQRKLSEQLVVVGAACGERIDEYHKLDTLFPTEELHGEKA